MDYVKSNVETPTGNLERTTQKMKTFALAAVVALLATTAFAAPAGWSRPGGYYDQVKGGSLSKPVGPCSPTTPTLVDTNGSEPGGEVIRQCGKADIPVYAQ
jgi:hypothetical protein